MRKSDPKVDLIGQIPAFRDASPSELKRLAAAADIITVKAGEWLCRADRRAFEAYLVVDGMVDVVAGETVLASLERGELVGELGVIDHGPRSADVVARTDVTALVIVAPVLWPLLDASPSLRAALLQQLADRIRKADRRLASAS
jgi:CRP/FNR family transcriptional regulator, cyclic AMP receptor protein